MIRSTTSERVETPARGCSSRPIGDPQFRAFGLVGGDEHSAPTTHRCVDLRSPSAESSVATDKVPPAVPSGSKGGIRNGVVGDGAARHRSDVVDTGPTSGARRMSISVAVLATVPSVTHTSARRRHRGLKTISPLPSSVIWSADEVTLPAWMSARILVPAAVPSLTQSSRPPAAVAATNTARRRRTR